MALDVLTTCFMSIHEACCISDANLLMLLTEAFALQALDGFSLCLWQLGEANGALTGSNVFALLHRLSSEPDPLLRRSIITAVGALSHPGMNATHCSMFAYACYATSVLSTCL